jgi:nickel-dependent lactate racemase
MPCLKESADEVRKGLENPLGAEPLARISKRKRNACIVVSDITRPVPNQIILPPIIEILEKAGIPSPQITLLVATGMHRPPTQAELVEMLGEKVATKYSVICHNARDGTAVKRIGYTRRGTPIDVNRLYLESEVKVVTGLVEPHFMAGFSGGRKSVAIGLTSVEAIKFLHGPALLEHAGSRNCGLDSNPLDAELLEIAAAAGADMTVSVVMDANRRVGKIFAGDLVRSHREACKFARTYQTEENCGLFDVVITSAAGYPLDTTYYQAIKGLVGALDILALGGHIVLAAECASGLGSPDFRSGLQLLRELRDYDKFLGYIGRPENFRIDQWEVEMLVKALRKARVFLFSDGISDIDWALTRTEKVDSVEEGLRQALKHAGRRARVAIIPEGPYFIPMASEAEPL